MKKFVALSMIGFVSLGLTACKKEEPAPAANEATTDVNATEAEAISDINAASANVADSANAALDNAAAVAAPADNATTNAQ